MQTRRRIDGLDAPDARESATPQVDSRPIAPVDAEIPVVIVGAGLGGVAMAIRLREAGIEDFVILEKAASFGGTWLHNSYPGAACDVPSALYSYSFAPNPGWNRKYGEQAEILAYVTDVARRRDLTRFVRFDHELARADWDETRGRWVLATNHGELCARVLIVAAGPFNDPQIPDVPGRESFEGEAFHTARWNHAVSLEGKRVAVIGTGASAIQVVPAIQPKVRELHVYQRTPSWIVPRIDRERSALEKTLVGRLPFMNQAARAFWYAGIESLGLSLFVDRRFVLPFEALGRMQLLRQVSDPILRAKLTPRYRLGCKRAVFSDAFYPALTQPNVELVTDGIAAIRPRSIVTRDGRERAVDAIVWGTGFHVPGKIWGLVHGRGGRSIAEMNGPRPESYLGTTLHGAPNLFTLLGPYSAAGNQSAVFMLECQAHYVAEGILAMRRAGATRIEPREAVQNAFVAEMVERSRDTTWLQGGCSSYYQSAEGGNGGLWPNFSFRFRQRTRRFDVENYVLRRGPEPFGPTQSTQSTQTTQSMRGAIAR